MDQLLIGVLLALLGLLLCFAGLRLWFLLLPLLAAAVGFYIGAQGIQAFFADSEFLATALSWFGGLILAVGFAVLSWYLWYAGVVILAAALGAIVATGLLHALFVNPWGWALVLVGLLGAVIGFWLAMALHLPGYIVVAGSALVGAALTIAGVMTMFGTITISELSNGVGIAVVDEVKNQGASWLWVVAGIILSIAGIMFQLQSLSTITLPEERWVPVRTGQAFAG
jgi:Domain of unknown function (DUF4203)